MPVRTKKSSSRGGSLLELVTIVAVALGLALGIQAFLVKPFRIPSESMVPTLEIGERVLVNRIGTHFSDPSHGDIVVFKPPKGSERDAQQCGLEPLPQGEACPRPTEQRSEQNFIKRVVAVGGDRLSVRNGQVYIDGKLQTGFTNPTASCGICNLRKEITIPSGHYFMMGDNRGGSEDSRVWGPVPKDWIIGGAFFTYWPPKRIGPL